MGLESKVELKETNNTVVWTLLLGLFIFHGVLEDIVPLFNVFDEIVGLLCFPFAVYDHIRSKQNQAVVKLTRNKYTELILLLMFLLCGLAGNLLYRYQPAWIAVASAVLASKFFMIVLTAGYLQKYMPIKLEEMELTIQGVSLLWFSYFVFSAMFPDVLAMPGAWDVCAKSSLLFALLIFCNHKRVWLYRVSLIVMIVMLILSGKEKSYGAILIFLLLYYLIVHKKVQAKIRYILYMAVPIVFLAWNKIYYYYIEGHGRYAKSIMTSTALRIAREYFPLGTGFGTFGSTYAEQHYSQVYYLYGIADNPELGVESKLYLTDLFWPILFGETGVLGTIIYCILILLLFMQIQKVYFYNRKKYFLLIYMFVFMLMTTFSEAGFMQPVVMIFAFIMGTLLEEYEEKRNRKLKYFNRESI